VKIMNFYINLLNNREKAIIFWLLFCLLIFLVWLLYPATLKKDIRTSIIDVLKVLFQKEIVAILTAMLFYVALIVFLFYKIKLWNISLITDTVFWFFGTAFVLLFNLLSNKEDKYFKKILLDSLKLVLVLEFIVNLYVFSLFVELVIMPILSFVVIMSIVAGTKKEYMTVKKLMDFILGIFGIYLIVFALSNIIAGFQAFATINNLRTFLLPLFLTIAFLPLIYFLLLYMAYDSIFVRLRGGSSKNGRLIKFTKLRIFQTCFVNLKKLNRFLNKYATRLMGISNEKDVTDIIQQFKNERA